MIFIENSDLRTRIEQGTAHWLRGNDQFATFWVDKHCVECDKTSSGQWSITSICETDIPDPSLPPPDEAAIAAKELVDEIRRTGNFSLEDIERNIAYLLRTWKR